MNGSDITRRRFLGLLAGLAGAGATGALARAVHRGGRAGDASVDAIEAPRVATRPDAARSSSPPGPSTPTTVSPPTTMVAAGGPGARQAICKDAWGARQAAGAFTEHTVQQMTVHHSGFPLTDNRTAPAQIRSNQELHIDGRGWPDIAYHFIVDAGGNVYEGRPVWAVGDTGTDYDPTGHFLVCAEGNFDQHVIPAAQLAAVADVLAWAAVRFGVDPSSIRGHRDRAKDTNCPGATFYRLVDDGSLERAVRDRIAAGAPGLAVLCGDAAAERIADIEAGLTRE